MSVDKLLSLKATVKLIKMEKDDESIVAYTSEPVSLIGFYGKVLPKKVSRQLEIQDEIPSPGSESDHSNESIFKNKPSSLRKNNRKVKPILGSNNTTHNVKKVKRATLRSKRIKGTNTEQEKDHDEEDFQNTSDIEEISELQRKRPVRTAFSRANKKINSFANKREMKESDNGRKPPLKGTREGSQRKAALEVAKKMANTEDFLRSLDKDLRKMKKEVYFDSESEEYSASEDEEEFSISRELNKKNIKQKENQKPPPDTKFCEYEKAAQEKVALRMQFLQSLDIFSEK